jgi:hypothetical protein
MDHNFELRKKCGLKLDHLDFVRDMALLVSTIINMYMFIFFEKGIDDNRGFLEVNSLTDWGIWGLGILHLVLSIIMVLFQFFLHSKLYYYEKLRAFLNDFKKRFSAVANTDN